MLGAFTLLLVYQLVGEVLVLARGTLNLLRIEDHAVRGFAVGVAAHGIGTARAFQVSETMGAFAGLAMGLNGLVTAFLFPLLVRLWGG